MPNLRRIFKNSDKLNLSAGWIAIIALASLGALFSYLGYSWIELATKKSVELRAVAPTPHVNMTNIKKPENSRIDVDVILAVDFSGSMDGDDGSDPNKLRLRAAEIMASTLAADIFPRNTSMGFVEFGQTALPTSELISVISDEDRQKLIDKIYQRSKESSEFDWQNLTNISGALDESQRLLEQMQADREKSGVNVKNVPAIVILTDGVPTIGRVVVNGQSVDGTKMDGVKAQINQLIDQGILVFVVVLRNPEKEKRTDGNYLEENKKFAEWREFWFATANERPEQIKYFEAQSDEQLEGMYNIIRSRLVREGTHPTDRVMYDPMNPNEGIVIPNNLLQAHLVVSKPLGVDSIDLISPDGWTFQDTSQADPRNKLLKGNWFYRFSLYKPIPGTWHLKTDSTKPLYYLLITESLYTAQPYTIVGKPYVLPNRTTELAFVIVDDQPKIVDGDFEIKASTVKSVQKEDGSFSEETTVIATLKKVQRNGVTQFILPVTPEMTAGKSELEFQIDGQSGNDIPINVSMIKVPVIDAPTMLKLSSPTPISCEHEKLIPWPPEIRCGNSILIDANVSPGELSDKESLYGNLYSPIGDNPIKMTILSNTVLQAEIVPLESLGKYEFSAIVGGKVKNQAADYEWIQQESIDVRLLPPLWVEPMKHRLWYLFVLFLLVAIWKPVIVTILLPIFALIKIAPSGYYNNSTDGSPSSIYERAMARRKLFTLTVGRSKKYADIDVYTPDGVGTIDDGDFPRTLLGRWMKSLMVWLQNQPRARLVAVPWNGIWCEKPTSEFTRAPKGHSYMTCTFDGMQMQVSQDDWQNQD